jgi:hypothetical protein
MTVLNNCRNDLQDEYRRCQQRIDQIEFDIVNYRQRSIEHRTDIGAMNMLSRTCSRE